LLAFENGAELRPFGIEQRFPTGENYPANSKVTDRFYMWLQIKEAEGTRILVFPDVAHDAAAVAGGVRVQDENR
jgi:hypothetical protein